MRIREDFALAADRIMKVLKEKKRATKIEICSVAKLRPGTVESVLKTYLRPRNYVVMKHEGFGKNKKTYYSLGSESTGYSFSSGLEGDPTQKSDQGEGKTAGLSSEPASREAELAAGMIRIELTNIPKGIHLKFEGPSSKLESFLQSIHAREMGLEELEEEEGS